MGYSSGQFYGDEGSFAEPMGRDGLQKLCQKYSVGIAFYGHVHNYERTCSIYQSMSDIRKPKKKAPQFVDLVFVSWNCATIVLQNQCVNSQVSHYSGKRNGTIHVVPGGGGSHVAGFSETVPRWSLYRDAGHGFVKLTAVNHSSLL